jgi:hypothetical protein
MSGQVSKIVDLLEQVVCGDHRTDERARQLESSILAEFSEADDDARFEQLMHILASNEPAGGPCLFPSGPRD